MRAEPVDLRGEGVKMCQITDADGAATDFVFVSGADPAPRRADLEGRCILAQAIEVAVEREDQRAGLGDVEVFGGDRYALSGELCHFIAQVPRVENDTIADNRKRPTHNAAGEQAELIDRAIDDERVSGIMPALKADDNIGARREKIDDLAFALIAPLRADYGDVGHLCFLR